MMVAIVSHFSRYLKHDEFGYSRVPRSNPRLRDTTSSGIQARPGNHRKAAAEVIDAFLSRRGTDAEDLFQLYSGQAAVLTHRPDTTKSSICQRNRETRYRETDLKSYHTYAQT